MAFCPQCFSELSADVLVCANCGAQFGESTAWRPVLTRPANPAANKTRVASTGNLLRATLVMALAFFLTYSLALAYGVGPNAFVLIGLVAVLPQGLLTGFLFGFLSALLCRLNVNLVIRAPQGAFIGGLAGSLTGLLFFMLGAPPYKLFPFMLGEARHELFGFVYIILGIIGGAIATHRFPIGMPETTER